MSLPAFPAPRTGCPFDPAPAYTEVREGPGIVEAGMWNGTTAWVVTRYDDVRAILADRRFSADGTRPGFLQFAPGVNPQVSTFIRMDDPEHARLRRMLARKFTVRSAESMRPEIQRITDEHVDRLLETGPPADLVTGLALPVPSLVISRLLGVPFDEAEFFQASTRKIMSWASSGEEAMGALVELGTYLSGLADRKAADPGDDVISALVTEYESTGELTRQQLVLMAVLLLIAGHETTAGTIALGIAALTRHPGQLAALRADPSLVPGAVEEVLRYASVVQSGLSRIVTEEVEICGRRLKEGDNVILYLPAANRDEKVYPNAAAFDIHREGPKHLGFGFGSHQCLGMSLARVEIQVAIRTVVQRIPTLAPAKPLQDLPFRHEMFVYGLHELPITW
ncbi:Cytochrome P450 [Amycolatopsis tolypomycina]|uniref:Cytochrome P450 n=1 Tax=Amycolatopsis tolypomycina TaxID=208445 RepID=A0A1H4ZUS1_9PSEU|nr:cytochrome P450 [Amycolatopsis tolypomycina]SED33211.1 Cytochrome P450 [Amycolatopsis tolypomycina]